MRSLLTLCALLACHTQRPPPRATVPDHGVQRHEGLAVFPGSIDALDSEGTSAVLSADAKIGSLALGRGAKVWWMKDGGVCVGPYPVELVGGTRLIYVLGESPSQAKEAPDLLASLRALIEEYGVRGGTADHGPSQDGESWLVVRLPGVTDSVQASQAIEPLLKEHPVLKMDIHAVGQSHAAELHQQLQGAAMKTDAQHRWCGRW